MGMLSMGFKIQEMVSMYEFDEASGKRTMHYTMIDPPPEKLRNLVVIDLWDIKASVNRHRKTLAENAEIFFSMRAEELHVAMSVDSPRVKKIFGRLYAVAQMIASPEEMEQYLDDDDFLTYVGEQEYAKLRPLFDKLEESRKG